MEATNVAGVVTKPYPVRDTLFFKIQGDDPAVKLTAKTVQAIVKKHGSDRFEFASTDQEAEDLWQNRKHALTSTMGANPGMRCWTTDVWFVNLLICDSFMNFCHHHCSVPVSKLPELVYETKKGYC